MSMIDVGTVVVAVEAVAVETIAETPATAKFTVNRAVVNISMTAMLVRTPATTMIRNMSNRSASPIPNCNRQIQAITIATHNRI